eukprot:TRINITY_DN107_c0_g1_i3.p1 TRINITY_DN107_c0_g1~~TRINITY_DN107_c0_g1_i3.p1  ORF type:complete len:223 (+),score=73.14 TRINITY_DN107_c0_g1_i3:66-734(+)
MCIRDRVSTQSTWGYQIPNPTEFLKMLSTSARNLVSKNLVFTNMRFFSGPLQKKAKMELTLRTPYRTFFENFDGFQRVITKSNESALVIQNKSPPALYVLPPGHLKVKLATEQKGTSGDYLHLGGWLTVHLDNTVEINLIDCFEKKDVRADQLDKGEALKERETAAGRYMTKLRKSAVRVFLKKATAQAQARLAKREYTCNNFQIRTLSSLVCVHFLMVLLP